MSHDTSSTTEHETAEDRLERHEEAAENAGGTGDADAVPSDVEAEAERRRVGELEEQLLRRAAEFQNYRRRTQEDLAFAADRGRAEVILRMIEVLDDLRRSRLAAEEAAANEKAGPLYEALKLGVDLVFKKFQDALAAFGVEEIPAVGETFDESLHEALMQQDAEDEASGTILDEIQKGYRMGDRVLRHAQVVVAR